MLRGGQGDDSLVGDNSSNDGDLDGGGDDVLRGGEFRQSDDILIGDNSSLSGQLSGGGENNLDSTREQENGLRGARMVGANFSSSGDAGGGGEDTLLDGDAATA